MDDDEVKGEFWFRKKPRRIIQNQAVIILMVMFGGMVSAPITLFIFYFIEVPIVIPTILVVWMVSVIIYVGGNIYRWRQELEAEKQ